MASAVKEIGGDRAFIIGDLHGCADEPRVLLEHLEKTKGLGPNDTVVFLGDYIDRGPDSRAVVDLLLQYRTHRPNTLFLKGNHEDMLLDFLGFEGRLGQAFLYNGGLETIQSYGISVFDPPEEMLKALPDDHLAFFQNLDSVVVFKEFVFVHAGLHPLRALSAQNDSDIFWIRDDFIHNVHPFGRTIVFGHTPHPEIFEHMPFKLGIDTGLVFRNKLTCLEVPSGEVFQISRNDTKVKSRTLDLSQRFKGTQK